MFIKTRIKRQLTPKSKYIKPKASEILLMKDDQVGRCAICEEELDKDTKHVHVDHCHETNIVRGLLCAHCNKGLGFFRDNIEVLEKAITYLKGDHFKKLL